MLSRIRVRAPFAFLRLLFLLGTLGLGAFAASTLHAETRDPGPFYGFWDLPEPAGDNCVVIIKRGGRISCFFPGSGSNQIMQGSWVRDDQQLTATWPNGHRDVFEVVNETTLRRLAFPAGTPLGGTPAYENRATQIDRRLAGSLRREDRATDRVTSPAQDVAAQRSDSLLSSPLIGYWKVPQSAGLLRGNERHFYLHLQRDGSAKTTLRAWDLAGEATGQWEMVDGRAIITWKDGQRDVLRSTGHQAAELAIFGRRQELSDRPNDRRNISRVAPAEVQGFFTAGATNLLTATDIRGTWVPTGQPDGARLEIGGWGQATRYFSAEDSTGTAGQWQLHDNRVVVTWPDGSRDILRLGTRSFVQESFPAGADAADAPSQVIEVDKLASDG